MSTAHGAAMSRTLRRGLFGILCAVAMGYALFAGLHTVTDYDVFWQLATGRWIAQNHRIPSVDVLSYTAQGQPWIYPVGSELLLYAIFLMGGYTLLSWLGATACIASVALLLQPGKLATAMLAIVAVPLIAARTSPRAEMFSVVLFAAFLPLLWQQYETGRAKLWLLPILMLAWVNLHLGFVSGLALIGGYLLLEVLQLLWPSERNAALQRLRRAWPWLLTTCLATLVNPWGWGIYQALLRQEAAMAAHSQSISEWASVPMNWTAATSTLSLRNPNATFLVLLLIVAFAVACAICRRQPGAAVLLVGSAFLGVRHIRLQGLFAVVVVVIAGAVFASFFDSLQSRIADVRIWSLPAMASVCFLVVLACVRCVDLVTNRTYLAATKIASFGTGLSWWFPEKAADFILRENIPGRIFNDYNEGGFVAWRLGPKYQDYIDGRAIPFGPELLKHTNELMQSPPDSPLWRSEAEKSDINTIIVPLGRYDALQFFPALPQFCSSDTWRPVYLDEVSAVFVRRQPETGALIQRSQVDCTSAPLPASPPAGADARAFNQWANAAAVLRVLGRNAEAFAATTRALAIFPHSPFIHFTRGILFQQAGNLREAEQEYLTAAALQPEAVAPWATLAAYFQERGKPELAVKAWERAAELSPQPWGFLLQLGYANLELHQPQAALSAFTRAAGSLPAPPTIVVDRSFLASLARGRAMSWSAVGGLSRAAAFQEEAIRWVPDDSRDWLYLAELYQRLGRSEDAQRARERALVLEQQQAPAAP